MNVTHDPKALLSLLFSAAVKAANPFDAIKANLPAKPRGRTVVVGAGKASVQMAQAFEKLWDGPLEGLIVAKRGQGMPCERIEVVEASHLVPDASSLRAAERLMNVVSGLGEDDLVVALISGGGSALLAAPQPGLTLADEVPVGEALLASGAPISAMNVVRTQLSTIKGGRLAIAAHPAKVVTLIVSDVPGDIAGLVASGPTVPSSSSHADALDIAKRYRVQLPRRVIVRVIASAAKSLEAAAELSQRLGVPAVILSDAVEGEASEIAKVHAAIAREVLNKNRPFKGPVVLLSGGEGTVTLRSDGKGGRNTEFLLSLAIDSADCNGIFALAFLASWSSAFNRATDEASAKAPALSSAPSIPSVSAAARQERCLDSVQRCG